MNKSKNKNLKRSDRRRRIRAKVSGDSKRPRMSVFRSNRLTSVQIIDYVAGKTIIGANSSELAGHGTKTLDAKELGKLIAKKASEAKIKEVVFDRSGYIYTGRVRAVAEGAREGGLKL